MNQMKDVERSKTNHVYTNLQNEHQLHQSGVPYDSYKAYGCLAF